MQSSVGTSRSDQTSGRPKGQPADQLNLRGHPVHRLLSTGRAEGHEGRVRRRLSRPVKGFKGFDTDGIHDPGRRRRTSRSPAIPQPIRLNELGSGTGAASDWSTTWNGAPFGKAELGKISGVRS